MDKRTERFIEIYARGIRNGPESAIRAGFHPSTAAVDSVVMLTDPEISRRIEARIVEIDKAAEFGADDVLRQWIQLATADPTRITRTRHVNCRYCWGVDGGYQWGSREYAEACDAALNHKSPKGVLEPRPLPSCEGGFGWNPTIPPNPECADCYGEGELDTYFADLSDLPPAERRLVSAVERDARGGIKIKMRDQDAALANLARYLGMLIERREVTGKNGAPLGAATIPVELPDDPMELGALYSQLVGL